MAESFDFKENPIAWLSYLQAIQPVGVYTITQPITGWVMATHIPALMAQLDSTQPCMPVLLATSATIKLKSTVGDEAALLIQSYRQNVAYPPKVYMTMDELKRELRQWWAEQAW